ncbi:hypothetical protein SEA_REFUGE_80 [Mycobacterium phage Refuge]|uniref:Uncharacterized protein n=1 Tax=Mycobacterium phage Refuge TaxID=2517967 RepID=A0A482JEP9_9CAUD|nr:site-specific recombination directionality factor RDF [Mycobacterium phage Refuge]QBP31098.1 hypothetical protein SEA_REFUGE_80 [Mycobacterium phage Refuge]
MTRILSAMTLIAALAVAILVLSGAPAAHAGPLCEHRSEAHIAQYGGLLKDSADHVARGELPTCDPNPESSQDDSQPDDDSKSRYCRKRWYC